MAKPAFGMDELTQAVRASAKYQAFDPHLVSRIAAQELGRHRKLDAAVKAVRTRLHQAAGAYLPPNYNYAQLSSELLEIGTEPLPEQKTRLKEMMRLHASTRERIPYLDLLYRRCLEGCGEFSSVLDLACGLNPLAIPWMPLAEGFSYLALDVIEPMLSALQAWFGAAELNAQTEVLDLSAKIPDQQAELALLLKTIPILDQLDSTAAPELLASLKARVTLVSFPAQSLGGRQKGMRASYTRRMEALLASLGLNADFSEFPNELVWRITKSG